MPRFAANLTFLWSELPPLARFRAAADWGFQHVEFLAPDELDRAGLQAALRDSGLQLALFNTRREPGSTVSVLGTPGQEDAFRRIIDDALDMAAATGARLVHVMGGAVATDVEPEHARDTAKRNLEAVAPFAQRAGVTLLLENINALDRPGDLFPTPEAAAAMVEAVNHPAVGLQFDFYHTGRAGLDPCAEYPRFRHLTRHIQLADAPGRHEPGSGTLPVQPFLDLLDHTGYDGLVGLEYAPSSGTDAALEWLRPYVRG